jgi:hypothetical protein
VGAAGADDLDGGLGVLGYFGQAVELASHDLAAADGAVQDAFVEDAPKLGRTRSVQYFLSGQAGGYLVVEVGQVAVGAGAEDRAGVVLGLEQAGDDERLVPAQDRGLGFDVGPLLEPAVQALLVALLQVIPQPGQRGVRRRAAARIRCRGRDRRGGELGHRWGRRREQRGGRGDLVHHGPRLKHLRSAGGASPVEEGGERSEDH